MEFDVSGKSLRLTSTQPIVMAEIGALYVSIYTALTLSDHEGTWVLDPENASQDLLEKLAQLDGHVIGQLTTQPGGTLYLKFADEVTISVAPDARYQAWDINDPSGVYICPPGGIEDDVEGSAS